MKDKYDSHSLMAFDRSLKLGLEPKLNYKKAITGVFTQNLSNLCKYELVPFLLQQFGNGYWGQQCLNIAPQTFMFLQHLGIDCELVYGEVSINGTDEFDTDYDELVKELENPGNAGFAIHVWIQIGKDFIIDPTVAARINKYYSEQFPAHQIVFGKSKKLLKDLKLDYKPMLAGAMYVTKTCGIPLEYNPEAV
ncbi:TPA: hypothetical protein ACMDSJ_004518 [Vibrio parahaemolyticus]